MHNAVLVLWSGAPESVIAEAIKLRGYSCVRTVTGVGDAAFVVDAVGADTDVLADQLKAIVKGLEVSWCQAAPITYDFPVPVEEDERMQLLMRVLPMTEAISIVNRVWKSHQLGVLREVCLSTLAVLDDAYAEQHGIGLLFSVGNQEIITAVDQYRKEQQ